MSSLWKREEEHCPDTAAGLIVSCLLLLSHRGSPEVVVQRGPIRSITLTSLFLQEEVTLLSLSPLITSLSSYVAWCCARLLQREEEPRKISAAPLPQSLADQFTFSPFSSCQRALMHSLSLSFSICMCLSSLVYHSVLSPLHCRRSALSIAALLLMCYYRKTQLRGIPFLPTRALPSSPNSLSFSLFLTLSPSSLLSKQPMQQPQPDWSPSSSLPVSVINSSEGLLWLYMFSNFIFAVRESIDELVNLFNI